MLQGYIEAKRERDEFFQEFAGLSCRLNVDRFVELVTAKGGDILTGRTAIAAQLEHVFNAFAKQMVIEVLKGLDSQVQHEAKRVRELLATIEADANGVPALAAE